jgi:hypothetical protein|tara:strand:- start:828 stop:1274 length:447 start_codon:yes stop_codon:yes gene_type:complete
MGTRSLTRIIPRQEGLAYDKAHNRAELSLVNIYQQYDGYPEYMAVEYAKWLEGLSIGNGLGRDPELNKYANGVGCFAAQFIKQFKDRPGGLYLQPIDNEEGWVDYIYTLFPKEGEETYMAIYHTISKDVIFVGKPDAVLKKYNKEELV